MAMTTSDYMMEKAGQAKPETPFGKLQEAVTSLRSTEQLVAVLAASLVGETPVSADDAKRDLSVGTFGMVGDLADQIADLSASISQHIHRISRQIP